jgi:hypothetical protein
MAFIGKVGQSAKMSKKWDKRDNYVAKWDKVV